MTDPFSLGTSILGIVGLTVQLGEILVKFGLNLATAPDDVRQSIAGIQALKTTLSITYTNAIANPEFKKAMRGKESALLKHFKEHDGSRKQADLNLSVATCSRKLQKLLAELQKVVRGGNSALGWSRLKMTFRASHTREAVEALHRQCQVLNNLIGIDSLALTIATRQEAQNDRRARQAWESNNHDDPKFDQVEGKNKERMEGEGLNRRSRLLNIISPSDYDQQQVDYQSRKTSGTGRWLLQSEEFIRWAGGTGGTLFCHGMPGSGKTMISSIAIDHLHRQTRGCPDVYVAFVYCTFKPKHEQSAESVVSSILRQLVQQIDDVDIPDYIDELYARDKTLPTPSQVANALELCAKKSFSKGYVVIDALDEFSASFDAVKNLVDQLKQIQQKTGLNLMVTTRQTYQAEHLFPAGCFKLEVRANDDDVRKYVRSRLPELPRYVRGDRGLQAQVESAITKHVHGMFLLAHLHLESLMDTKSARAMRTALTELNSGEDADAYKMAYEKAMDRIKGQTDGQRMLATQVLSWITFAKQPLTTLELQHALAADFDDEYFDPDNITDVDFIRSVCAGLVTVDKIGGVIRLVHHTAHQYLDQTLAIHSPPGNWQIATTCLRYLAYRNVSPGPLLSRAEHRKRLRQWPLYAYASKHWYQHAVAADAADRKGPWQPPDINKLLQNIHACSGAYQTAVIAKYARYQESDFYSVGWDFTSRSACSMALHCAAFFGDEAPARELLQSGHDVNQVDFEGMTSLKVAARQGHSKLVKMLLCEWRAEATTSEQLKSPLHYATTFNQEEAVRVLLQHSPVDNDGSAPLAQAIGLGQVGLVKLLLSDERVYPYVALEDGRSGLTIAASSGFADVVDLLLPASVQEVFDRGRTALSLSIQKGHGNTARRLMDDHRVFDGLDTRQGLAILSSVIDSGDVGLLSHLVQALARAFKINTQESDRQDRDLCYSDYRVWRDRWKWKTTPLVLAVQAGRLDLVSSLLAYPGFDVNARDELGRTALSWAVETGAVPILQVLLEARDIDLLRECSRLWAPLHYAVAGRCKETMSMLVAPGRRAAPNGMDVSIIEHVKDVGVAQVMLDAAPNAKWGCRLYKFYEEGDERHDLIEILCPHADLRQYPPDAWIIHLAANRGDVWTVNLLLKHGADIHDEERMRDPDDHCPLLLSALEHAPKSVSDDFYQAMYRPGCRVHI